MNKQFCKGLPLVVFGDDIELPVDFDNVAKFKNIGVIQLSKCFAFILE